MSPYEILFFVFSLVFLVTFIECIFLALLAVAQWIVHMPPKRGIQVRFLSAGPLDRQNLSTAHVDKSAKVFVSLRFV